MPAVGLVRTLPVPGKDLEDDVSTDSVGRRPPVGHLAAVELIAIGEDDEAPVDVQVAGIVPIVIPQVGQIRFDLRRRGVALAFSLVVGRPEEAGARGRRQERGDAPVGLGALPPPGGDPRLDVPVLHRPDLLPQSGRVAPVVEPQRRAIPRVRRDAALRPSLREPWIVESRSDREGLSGPRAVPVKMVVGRTRVHGVAAGLMRRCRTGGQKKRRSYGCDRRAKQGGA